MSPDETARRAIEVVDIESGEVIHRIPTEATGRALEKVVRGMLLRVDLERFYVREPVANDQQQS